MNIIEVIPIGRSVGAETLSYFTAQDVPIGSIINVPLRKKTIHAIVTASRKAEDMKGEIKSAGFALKKIVKVKSHEIFLPEFMQALHETANYYATSTGAVIDIAVPDYILKNVGKLKGSTETEKKIIQAKTVKEKYLVQGNDEERYDTWKSLVRQEFARKKSVIFIVPTIEDAEYSFSLMEKGIEGYAYMLHGELTAKEVVGRWNSIMNEKHPVVVIAVGGFLSVPKENIETIIIERESSKSYKSSRRPFLDVRYLAETLASKRGIKIFFGDNILRTETLWRESEGDMVQATPFKFRLISTADDKMVDMKKHKMSESGFKILSDEVLDLIKKTKDDSEHMVILAGRRGIAPTTICGDCQNTVVCNNCSSPVVIHKTGEKSFFMCHRCGERRTTEEYCKTCGSWKLTALGIGIDLVYEKIKDKFPEINIFKIDSDSIDKGEKSAKNIAEKWRAKPGSLLIGTEMMLTYVHEKVENSAIISIDSLFALPDFRIQEKILHMIIRIRSFTTKNFIVQTRKNDEKVFEYGLKGNMTEFYKSTIEERKRFNYPPFTTLIKITLEGKKDKIVKEMEEAQNILDPYEVEVFPAFTHTVRGNYVLHGLLRIKSDEWPDSELIEKLRALSPSVTVKVDPETLL